MYVTSEGSNLIRVTGRKVQIYMPELEQVKSPTYYKVSYVPVLNNKLRE